MTSEDPQSPLRQQLTEVEHLEAHIPNPSLTEIDGRVGEPQFPNNAQTLDPQIALDPPPEEVNRAAKDVNQEASEEVEEEPEAELGMLFATPSRGVTATKATPWRRGCKRKRVNKKKLEVLKQKAQILAASLKLVPFVPNKALDIASHESLLRRIGLWDFVHVELDSSDLRVDLIAQLVVNYKRQGRLSEVGGFRIKVSRADLGRALKLPPVKKDNNSVITLVDEDAEFVTEQSVHFIEELMSNWMLLHDDEAWILPEEVMTWIELIRKGHPDKVEWASLMWFMVEKEISQGVSLTDCYYASHLQHLIKHQNPRLFLADAGEDFSAKECKEEYGGDVTIVDESHELAAPAVSEDFVDEKMTLAASEECDDEKTLGSVGEVFADDKISEEGICVEASPIITDTHIKESSCPIEMDNSNDSRDLNYDFPEVKSEEPSVELTLGQDNNAEKDNAQPDDVMNFDDLVSGDSDCWQLNKENADEQSILRQCSFRRDEDSLNREGKEEEDIIEEEKVDGDDDGHDVDIGDDGDGDDVDEVEGEGEGEEVDEELEEEDDNDDDDVGEEGGSDLHEKFDSLQCISDDHMLQGIDISQGAFGSPLSLINESSMQHFVSHTGPSSSTFGNTLKRLANHEPDLSYHTDADGNKRLRRDATWDHQEPSDFYRCMENIEHWIGKAKMTYVAKEHECTQMSMNQQMLYAELEQRNHLIEHHERIGNEVRQKSQMEIYKLERELFIMGGLLDSYRKALKETRREFSEYRERCSVPEEPLYKDAGPGGVVLSVAELERQRLKQEEEDKMKFIELEITFKRFETEWHALFEGHHNNVQKLYEKFLILEEKVTLLKGLPRNQKAQEITEQPATAEDLAGGDS